MTKLVIVESPVKSKTISKYLGSGYTVLSSGGHVIDLPKTGLGVDIEHDFAPTYVVMPAKRKIIKELVAAAKTADEVLLACDPDREGEAIAWHLSTQLPRGTKFQRITFQEITKSAITAALAAPRPIDQNLVDAQQARRVLDRLVGYQVSPLLWKSVKASNLSAGRVQSVALRLICEREEEIRSFNAREYWTVDSILTNADKAIFDAELVKIGAEKLARPTGDDGENGKKDKGLVLAREKALSAAQDIWLENLKVENIEVKEKNGYPPPPFITSTLQQAASNMLSMSNYRTMATAQDLYEGINLGAEGSVGLITYMRTDSLRVSGEAIAAGRRQIEGMLGAEYVPEKPNFYRNKSTAQDAHEAIRPTNPAYEPEHIRKHLSNDQYRLYRLIYYRFLASQMVPARLESTRADISAGLEYRLAATGNRVLFPGYLKAYWQSAESIREREKELPKLSVGETLEKVTLTSLQHFTQPPARYNEASLVKVLEESGIGRPSTYAAIVKTLEDRDYVSKVKRTFYPTDLGELISSMLVRAFPDIITVPFTARLEEELDEIEEGKLEWTKAIAEFYAQFKKDLDEAPDKLYAARKDLETLTDIICEKCGAPMKIKYGRSGKFLGCSNYPDCTSTKPFEVREGKIVIIEPKLTQTLCPVCHKPMVEKTGRFGKFLACSDYPTCKTALPLGSIVTDIACPRKGCHGVLIERKSKRGSYFTCSTGTDCPVVSYTPPEEVPCVVCDYPLTAPKGKKGTERICFNPDCASFMKRRTRVKTTKTGRATKPARKSTARKTTRKRKSTSKK
jgi:DNA topoisomerase I